MVRLPRLALAECPYHVTHRGNRGSAVFFTESDRDRYRAWLEEYAARYGLEVWAYCLMTNHVHLLVQGKSADSMPRALGAAHGRYSRALNHVRGWKGHVWENRYFSTALDERHLWAAVRYIEMNPVRAGLVARANDYAWSSARAHAGESDDPLLSPGRPFPGGERDWIAWLEQSGYESSFEAIRRNSRTGRPTGSDEFLDSLEQETGRTLRPQRPGRRPG